MCVVAWLKSYLVKMLGPMHKDCLSSKSEANLSNLMKERKKERKQRREREKTRKARRKEKKREKKKRSSWQTHY